MILPAIATRFTLCAMMNDKISSLIARSMRTSTLRTSHLFISIASSLLSTMPAATFVAVSSSGPYYAMVAIGKPPGWLRNFS